MEFSCRCIFIVQINDNKLGLKRFIKYKNSLFIGNTIKMKIAKLLCVWIGIEILFDNDICLNKKYIGNFDKCPLIIKTFNVYISAKFG